ncbi:hypothetical protein CARUB_v10027813mg [Capsella rubella]|uniref:PDZ domain-containing protein n=1 Tax=Capsella rubella TaxID=81985 RepID=R0F018_9BRAS|nr:hypothetical protein CARUB_v10027813mg [Capsella rubella]
MGLELLTVCEEAKKSCDFSEKIDRTWRRRESRREEKRRWLGFPREDIDIPMTSGFSVTSRPMEVDVLTSIPFAMVDEITESSPAAEDGLQLGDQVVKFGNVGGGDNLLQRLAAEAQSNQGQAVSIQVMRQGAKVDLSVTPRIWQGRGLLGCHFRLV